MSSFGRRVFLREIIKVHKAYIAIKHGWTHGTVIPRTCWSENVVFWIQHKHWYEYNWNLGLYTTHQEQPLPIK